VALGAACKSAMLQNGIPAVIKRETLVVAAEFLNDKDGARAARGADVIGMLLEQNGLEASEIDRYLGLLKSKFERELGGKNTLRGDLLGTMAELCANRSACKQGAHKRFRQVFEDAFHDENDGVREEAIEGFLHIDREGTLGRLRQDFVNDSSAKIRERLIELAAELGGAEDVPWLMPKLGMNGEAEAAFRTLLTVLSRSQIDLLENQWFSELVAIRAQQRLSDSQWSSLLELAERQAEGRPKFLHRIYREWTTLLKKQKGSLADQTVYWEKLTQGGQGGERNEDIAALLDLYLRQKKVDASVTTLQALVSKGDLSPNGPVLGVLSRLFATSTSDGGEGETIRAVVNGVPMGDNRPVWNAHRARWTAQEESGQAGTDGSIE